MCVCQPMNVFTQSHSWRSSLHCLVCCQLSIPAHGRLVCYKPYLFLVFRHSTPSLTKLFLGLWHVLDKTLHCTKLSSRKSYTQYVERHVVSYLATAALNPFFFPLPWEIGTPKTLHSKQDLDPFGHFCKAQSRDRHTTLRDCRTQKGKI